MNEQTKQNLENRSATIAAQVGRLAYQRRDYQLKIEAIDTQVAQMEAQGVVIEATLNDINRDEARENERKLKELIDAKAKRSKAGKTGAVKRTSKG